MTSAETTVMNRKLYSAIILWLDIQGNNSLPVVNANYLTSLTYCLKTIRYDPSVMFSTQKYSSRLLLLVSNRAKVVSLFYIVIETAENYAIKSANAGIFIYVWRFCATVFVNG